MKNVGLAAAAIVVVLALVGFIFVTTDIFDGLLGGNEPPAFAASITASIVNRTATLNVTVTGGAAPYSYIYDFGDGTSRITTEKGVVYTYVAAGTYTVSVLVRDSVDNIVEAIVNVMVT